MKPVPVHTVVCFVYAMDSLQTLACRAFLEHSSTGTEVPHDIPGTVESWVRSWAACAGLQPDDSVVDMVRECVEQGWSCRLRVTRAFTEEVCVFCDTLGVRRITSALDQPGFGDITISTQIGWKLRVKDFETVRRKVRDDKRKQLEFQRRYIVVKQDVTEIMDHIRRCESWEDCLAFILWGEIRGHIESLPPRMQKPCVSRLIEDGVLDSFEI